MNIILVSDWQGVNYHRMVIPFGRMAQQKMANIHIIEDVLDLLHMDLSKVNNFIFSRHLQLTPKGYETIGLLLKEACGS